MSRDSWRKNKRLELLGWIIFVVSAFFFIAASLRTGDIVGLLGGLSFMIGCGVFLFAVVRRGGDD